jgi:Na+-driven multidrug efflux pump
MEKNKMAIMPIKKLVITMSIPVIFSMMIQALYNFVDSLYVARINEQALTALGLAFPLQMIIIAVFLGLGVGINSSLMYLQKIPRS